MRRNWPLGIRPSLRASPRLMWSFWVKQYELNYRDLSCPTFQGHWKWRRSTGYPTLPLSDPWYNQEPISYRVRNKWRFRSKIANFPHHMYLMPPLSGSHWNCVTVVGLKKVEWCLTSLSKKFDEERKITKKWKPLSRISPVQYNPIYINLMDTQKRTRSLHSQPCITKMDETYEKEAGKERRWT